MKANKAKLGFMMYKIGSEDNFAPIQKYATLSQSEPMKAVKLANVISSSGVV